MAQIHFTTNLAVPPNLQGAQTRSLWDRHFQRAADPSEIIAIFIPVG